MVTAWSHPGHSHAGPGLDLGAVLHASAGDADADPEGVPHRPVAAPALRRGRGGLRDQPLRRGPLLWHRCRGENAIIIDTGMVRRSESVLANSRLRNAFLTHTTCYKQ